jgi:hypothetical protein
MVIGPYLDETRSRSKGRSEPTHPSRGYPRMVGSLQRKLDRPDQNSLGTWERVVGLLVFLALMSPVGIAIVGVARGASTLDLARLAGIAQGAAWPLLGFFALFVWREEIPSLLSRLRRAGPKGLEFADRAISDFSGAQVRQPRRTPKRLEPPAPAADAASPTSQTGQNSET